MSVSDSRLQMTALGALIDNGTKWISGAEPASLYVQLRDDMAYELPDSFVYKNAQLTRMSNGYPDASISEEEAWEATNKANAAHGIGTKKKPDINEEAKKAAPGLFKATESLANFFGNPQASMMTVIVVIVGILLIGLAAYSVAVPSSARGDIAKAVLLGGK